MITSNRIEKLHQTIQAYVAIFVLWGIYRLVFRLPEEIEETILKPLVFIGTVLLVVRPKNRLKFWFEIWGQGDWLKALGYGLLFGLGYVLLYGISSFLSFGNLEFGRMVFGRLWPTFFGLGILTAIWEEWTFAGYILKQLRAVFKRVWAARLTTAFLFTMIHFPILAFWYKFTDGVLLFQLLLLFILGVGNTILMEKTDNLLAPIISHALWGIALFLFR